MTQATRPNAQALIESQPPVSLELAEVIVLELILMALLDAMLDDEFFERASRSTVCKVATLRDSMPEKYRDAFLRIVETSFDDGGLSTQTASARLASIGITIGATTIDKHRRGVCNCKKG